jgi:hypothetical protein
VPSVDGNVKDGALAHAAVPNQELHGVVSVLTTLAGAVAGHAQGQAQHGQLDVLQYQVLGVAQEVTHRPKHNAW